MRDVSQVARGERVSVYAGSAPQGHGRFEGFDARTGVVTVSVDGLGEVSFHLGSWFTALDHEGRELGVIPAGEPVLTGDPPERE